MSDIVLGIKLKYDGKDVTGGVAISREQFRQIAVDARKAGEATSGSFTTAAQGVRSMSAQLDQAKNAVIGYLGVTQGVHAARWILDQASAMQQLDARLKVATASQAEYVHASAGVFEVANRWGAAVDETAKTFARLNPVVAQLGGNSATTLKMMDGLGASLRLSGASTAETSAVLMQFSQAMGSGRVSGDEFRSMMENAEPLMRAVGKELNKTTGELRQMAEDGQLTSSVFGNALLPAIDKLKKQAEQIPLGISQAWQVLENNLKRDFGREFAGQSSEVGAALKALSDHSAEAAKTVRVLTDGMVYLGKAGLALGAGAGAAWIAKQGEAAAASAQAFVVSRAARIADAQAAEVQAAADVKRAQTTLALMATERERALATLATNNATILSTSNIGAHSAALRYGADAAAKKSAALLMLADASKIQSIATRELTVAETALAAAHARTAEATAIGAGAATLASRAVTALGGPIGAATMLLTVGATAWALWGESASSASEKAKKSIDAALDRADRRAKEAKFGAGELGQDREALTAIQSQLADARRSADSAIYTHIRESAREEVRRLESEEARIKASVAQAQQANPPADKPLSAAGEWGKLTESLKWREKIVKKYDEDLLKLQTSYADKWREASEKDRPAILRNQQAALAALAQEHKSALEGLPDAKEGKATADALAEARIRAAEVASKRVLEVLKREHDQYRMSTSDYLNTMAAVKSNAIGQEIDGLQAKLAAATKESERIPLREKIRELRTQLAEIPADTASAFEHAESQAQEALGRLAVVAGRSLDPLTQAGIQFSKDFGAVMQKAAADGREDVIEAGRQAWAALAGQAQFDDAKHQYDALFEQLKAELEAVRQEAERDGGWLAGINAASKAEEIKSRLMPQLDELGRKLDDLADKNPLNQKTAETAKRELQRAANDISPIWKKAVEGIDRTFHDGFARMLEGGKNSWEAFSESLKNTFKTTVADAIYQMFARPFVFQAVASVAGSMGMSGAANAFGSVGGSGGGIGDLFSMGSSVNNLLGGASAAYSTGAYMTLGSMGMEQAAMLAAQDAVFGAAGTAATLEAAGASAFMSTIGTALPYVGAALAVASMLGAFDDGGEDPHNNPQASGYHLTLSKAGATGAAGLASPSSFQAGPTSGAGWWGDNSALSAEQVAALDKQTAAAFAQGHALALSLGVDPLLADKASVISTLHGNPSNGAIAGYFSSIEQAFAALGDAIAYQVIPNLNEFQASGESLAQTAARLSQEFALTNKMATLMGHDAATAFGGNNLAARDTLIQSLGGLGGATSVFDSYYKNFHSETERRADTTGSITATLRALGITDVPATRDQFRALVEGQDLATESGRAMYATLLSVADAFAGITESADAAAKAAAAAMSTDRFRTRADYRFAQKTGIMPAYADGGVHDGGWAVVGEQGWELAHMGPSRIYSNSDSKSLLDMSQVTQAIDNLRSDLRAVNAALARSANKTARTLDKWDVDGLPAERVL